VLELSNHRFALSLARRDVKKVLRRVKEGREKRFPPLLSSLKSRSPLGGEGDSDGVVEAVNKKFWKMLDPAPKEKRGNLQGGAKSRPNLRLGKSI